MDVKEMGRSFAIDAKNTGKAGAKITYARGFSTILPHEAALPVVPSYLANGLFREDSFEWIDPGKTMDLLTESGCLGLVADLSDISLCQDIQNKKSVLWVYGRICYGD